MTNALPSAHSKVGASSMHRWAACPGSVRLCLTVPQTESSVYAAEGTVAHDIGAKTLLGKHVPSIGTFVMQDGHKIEVTGEMYAAVAEYVVYVTSRKTPSDTLLIEQGFHLETLHPSLYGTADAVIWKPYSRHLHVIDYKHGAGVPVDVRGNPQLRYYALGALLSSGHNAREVTVTIVQPRCPHPDGVIRSETFDAFELVDWGAELVAAVKRTEDPNAPLHPGEHCRFCPAAAICPALHERATAMAQISFTPVVAGSDGRAVVPYDPAKLKLALDSRDALKAWIKALDEFAYAEAVAGRLPPEVGYKLVAKRPTRVWTDDAAVVEYFRSKSISDGDCDYIYAPKELLSPAQLEKVMGKKQFKEIEQKFVEKKSSGNTLAPVDDPRPEVRILDAAAEFARVPATTEEA